MSLFGFYHFIILLYIWNICTPIIGIRTRKIVLSPFLLYFTIIYLFSLSSFLITNIHTAMNPSHTYIYQFCPKNGGFGAMFPYQIYQFVTTKYFLVFVHFTEFLEVFLLRRPAEDSPHIFVLTSIYTIFSVTR